MEEVGLLLIDLFRPATNLSVWIWSLQGLWTLLLVLPLSLKALAMLWIVLLGYYRGLVMVVALWTAQCILMMAD